MIGIDGFQKRGIYGTTGPAAAAAAAGYGSNGGPSITASSFAAAAAAAAAASNGANSTSAAVPAMMLMPGTPAASSVQQQQQQQQQPAVSWGEMVRSRREYTFLKKVVQLLQDNRLKSGDEEAAEELRELNRSQNESFPVLKTILNAIFISTGVVLLIAVVVVIIYTSIVKPDTDMLPFDSSRNPPSKHEPGSPGSSSSGSSNYQPHAPAQSSAYPADMINDVSVGSDSAGYRGVTKCRTIAMQEEGVDVARIVELCFQAPSTYDQVPGGTERKSRVGRRSDTTS